MTFLNEYEITDLRFFFHAEDTPNLARGAEALGNLMVWTNQNSDGWPYWTKPARAARQLMDLLNAAQSEYFKGNEVEDCTEQDLRKVLVPVKRFLTTQGVSHEQVIR